MAVFLSETAKDLIRSNFFGKDFDTYVQEINDQLILQFGAEVAGNIVLSDYGQYLIEMHAFALSTMSWYGDRQADDTTLRYVRLRSAANVIARQLGYKPRAAVPPAIDVTMTLAFPPSLTRLTLEQGRILIGPNGLFYVTTEEVVFDVGEVGPKTFSAVEGEIIEEIFTSNGTPNQFFFLETVPVGTSIAQDSPRVYVNSTEWSEQGLLVFQRINEFEVQYGFNPPRLQFGDGVAGNIPPKDAEIRVTFLATSGPAGAVQANTVVNFQAPLVAGSQTLTATLTHGVSTPGSPRETIDSIRINAPLVTQTADRAVTQKDLDALINAFIDPVFGAVAKGRATVPRTVADDAEALTIIGLIDACCPVLLTHGGATLGNGGDFAAGNLISGSLSGATGTIARVTDTTSLEVVSIEDGPFVVGDIITDATSGATATLSLVEDPGVADRLRTYWDGVLASNCKTNVVNAQVLSADATGRYVSAPVGLAQALDAYLNDRAESTVQVVVTDGSINLFTVSLGVGVNLADGFNNEVARQTVFANVISTLELELLGRDYGESLRASDLYALVEAVEGVVYSHISILAVNGTTPGLGLINEFGDLEIEDFQVITLGAAPVVTQI